MNNKKLIHHWLIPIVLFSIAFIWKFFYIDSRDVCLDDPFTIFHAQKSLGDILRLPAQNEPNPPLFMIVLHFWIKLFGIGVYSVRVLPLLFNSLTVVLIYFTGKKFSNVWGGVISGGLFLLSTYHFYFGLETRTYSLLSMATAGALYSFLSLLEKPEQRKYLLSLIMWNVVLIYSHYFGFFVVFVQALISILYIKKRNFLRSAIIAFSTTAVSFIPMGIIFVKQFLKSKQGTWVAPPVRSEYLNQLKLFANATVVLKIVVVLCVLALIWFIIQKPQKEKVRLLVSVFLWWFVPYSIMFLVSSKIPMFINRYILFNTIGFFVFIGILIPLAFKRYNIVVFLATAIIFVAMFKKLEINSKHFYYREVRNSINHLMTHKDTSSIVLIHPHWANRGFVYYYEPELFKTVEGYDSLLNENGIFPVWDVHFTKNVLEANKHKKILYYQNASIFNDKNNSIFKHLDATYTRIDSAFYPQCFYVSAFVQKDTVSYNKQKID